MRAQVTITDLTLAQWDRVQDRLMTSYEIEPGTPTVCAVFELTPDMAERHAEMPVFEFAMLMAELVQVNEVIDRIIGIGQSGRTYQLYKTSSCTATKPLTLGTSASRPVLPTPDEVRNLSAKEAADLAWGMNIPQQVKDQISVEAGLSDQVRLNCAFCGRERSAKDDNHADDCAYWVVGPGSLTRGIDE